MGQSNEEIRTKEEKSEIRRLRAEILTLEASIRSGMRRERNYYAGIGYKNELVWHPPCKGYHTEQIKERILNLKEALASLLEAQIAPQVRLVIQDRTRPKHPPTSRRINPLISGRKSCPADRRDISAIWRASTLEEVIEPLVREETPEDRLKVDQSSLRFLSGKPPKKKWGKKPEADDPTPKHWFRTHKVILEEARQKREIDHLKSLVEKPEQT